MNRPMAKSEQRAVGFADGMYEQLMAEIPPVERAGFSAEQCAALRKAAERFRWGWHPVNIRITIPMPWGSYYCVLVGGPERRGATRRELERRRHPLWTRRNSILLAPLTVIMFVAGVTLAMTLVDFLKAL